MKSKKMTTKANKKFHYSIEMIMDDHYGFLRHGGKIVRTLAVDKAKVVEAILVEKATVLKLVTAESDEWNIVIDSQGLITKEQSQQFIGIEVSVKKVVVEFPIQ